jgi:hypothetical protein
MTVDESKALKKGTRVWWQGDGADNQSSPAAQPSHAAPSNLPKSVT